MQNITRKAVRPSDSQEHVKFRSIQADEYTFKKNNKSKEILRLFSFKRWFDFYFSSLRMDKKKLPEPHGGGSLTWTVSIMKPKRP
jgi:hypothetical protein